MKRPIAALELLRLRAEMKRGPQQFAPIRLDCADGSCGRCHSCRGTKSVPVALRRGGQGK